MVVAYDDIEEVARECAEGWKEVMSQTGPCYHHFETCGGVGVVDADGVMRQGWRFGVILQAFPKAGSLIASAHAEFRAEFEQYMIRLTRRGTFDAFVAVLEEGPKGPNDVHFFMRLAAAARGDAVEAGGE